MRIFDPQPIGHVPLPDTFAGQFFLLEYDPVGRDYTLTVDDEDRSTFNLGDKVPDVVQVFVNRGYARREIERLVDITREFRAAQFIPPAASLLEARILPIFDRSSPSRTSPIDEPSNGLLHFK
mgnify:CR=1 FL=1